MGPGLPGESSCGPDRPSPSYGGGTLPPEVLWRSILNSLTFPNSRVFAMRSCQAATGSCLHLGGQSPEGWQSFQKQTHAYPGDPQDSGHPLGCQRIPSPTFSRLPHAVSSSGFHLAQVFSNFGTPKGVEAGCLLGVVVSSFSSGLRRGLRRAEPVETSSPGLREGPTWVPLLSVLPAAVWL